MYTSTLAVVGGCLDWARGAAGPFSLLDGDLLFPYQGGGVDAQGQRELVERRGMGFPDPTFDLANCGWSNSRLLGEFGQGHARANARDLNAMHLPPSLYVGTLQRGRCLWQIGIVFEEFRHF